uniref:ANK_REP_REGION domain-containing protein n=1 Tax=Steinernema glaseri TaxID=37863 RepID=A0A1I7Y0A0_9BILA
MTKTNEVEETRFLEGECILFQSAYEGHPTSRPGGFLSQFWDKYGVVARTGDEDDAACRAKCVFFLSFNEAVKRVIVKLSVLSLKRVKKVQFANDSKALLASKDGTVEVVRFALRNNNEAWITKSNGMAVRLEDALQTGQIVPVYEAVVESQNPIMQALFMQASKKFMRMKPILKEHKNKVNEICNEDALQAGQIVPGYEAVVESRKEANDQQNPIMQALFIQASGKFVKIKPVLKEHKDKVNEICNGKFPLHYAMEKEMWQAARTLLAYGALASVKNADGNNGYHLAVLMNQASLIAEFSKRNLSGVNAKNARGQRPFHMAIEKSYWSCVTAIISCPLANLNSRDANGDTALHLLVRMEEMPFVLSSIEKILADSSVDYTKRNQKSLSMFEEAILCGQQKTVDLICKAAPGVIPLQDANGNFPIHLTTQEGKCQILHQILNYNASAALSLNSKGQTPLHMAVAQWKGDTQNHVDRLACIQNLVDMKVDLNFRDKDGETIGHYLAREALKTSAPDEDILKLLRKKEMFRSNIRLLDFAEAIWPHFHVAAFCYLLLMGLDLFAKDNKGFPVIDYFHNLPQLSDLLEEYAHRGSPQALGPERKTRIERERRKRDW